MHPLPLSLTSFYNSAASELCSIFTMYLHLSRIAYVLSYTKLQPQSKWFIKWVFAFQAFLCSFFYKEIISIKLWFAFNNWEWNNWSFIKVFLECKFSNVNLISRHVWSIIVELVKLIQLYIRHQKSVFSNSAWFRSFNIRAHESLCRAYRAKLVNRNHPLMSAEKESPQRYVIMLESAPSSVFDSLRFLPSIRMLIVVAINPWHNQRAFSSFSYFSFSVIDGSFIAYYGWAQQLQF